MRRDGDDDPFTAGRGGPPVGGVSADETDRVDVQEYDDRLVVVADLPGVSEDSLDLRCDGRVLAIHATAESGPFLLRVDLPAYVAAESMERTLNNGILEVALTRERDPADIGFR